MKSADIKKRRQDRYCGNAKELLRVGLHWLVPFIEDLSETVQVIWWLVDCEVKSTPGACLLKGGHGNAWMTGCSDQAWCSK